MNKLSEILKSARFLEILLLTVMISVLLLLFAGEKASNTVLSAEQRMERTLSQIKGAGEVRVMINDDKEIQGVVVLADGADDISVMLTIQRSVQVLTGLPIEKIEIFKAE